MTHLRLLVARPSWSFVASTKRFLDSCSNQMCHTQLKGAMSTLCRSRLDLQSIKSARHLNKIVKTFIARQFSSTNNQAFLWKLSEKGLEPGKRIHAPGKTHDGKSNLDRYIFVKTLINFYDDIGDGIILDTAYADSQPNADFDPSVPVVVGLHDTPGTHHELLPILNILAKAGCRTIAPTFPGHGHTLGLVSGYDDIFSHSTTERAVFVHDFLEDLGIERVDVLVGLGAACYPTMRLCAGSHESHIDYRSMALLSPWPLQRPRYEPNPHVTERIHRLWENPMLRPSVQFQLPSFQFGPAHSQRDKVTAAYLLYNLDLGEAGGLAMASSALNVPRVVLFGSMDPDVEEELYFDVTDCLDIPRDNLSVFEGKHVAPMLPGGMKFPKGGYSLHAQHPGVISAYLLHIVKLFHPNFQL